MNGRYFQIGAVEDVQVWVALDRQRDLEATVLVVNESDRSVTFRPSEIRVEAKRRGRETRLRTFSAEEWEEKLRSEYGIEGTPGAQAVPNEEHPTTTSSGAGNTGILWGDPCAGVTQGTEAGAVTTWSTREDCVQGHGGTTAEVSAWRRQRAAASEAAIANLARTHTLVPGSSYLGTVHIKKKKADQYRVTVPFGGEIFSFAFVFE